MRNTHLQKGGSLAEYAVAPITSTVKRPPIISPVEGASVPVTGLTALQSAKNVAGIRLDGSSNLNVLITAASGGVGTLYVQVCIPASHWRSRLMLGLAASEAMQQVRLWSPATIRL
jgi:NADPH:quinone reductase-like Zn-dependent oxidoreductase